VSDRGTTPRPRRSNDSVRGEFSYVNIIRGGSDSGEGEQHAQEGDAHCLHINLGSAPVRKRSLTDGQRFAALTRLTLEPSQRSETRMMRIGTRKCRIGAADASREPRCPRVPVGAT